MSSPVDDDTLSELGDSAVSDALLFEHNRRFQAAVLRTMETQMASMEQITQSKDLELQSSQKAREDLAIGFAEMRKELQRLNRAHEKSTRELRSTQHSQATLSNEKMHLGSELTAEKKRTTSLESELSRLRVDLSATREELHAGKQLHQLFSSDITMHRQLKENLAGDIRSLQTELKKREASAEELQTKCDKKEAECTALRNELHDQSSQTSRAQMELERVVHELSLLKASREVMTKQWEGALSAMHKRDQTMTTVTAQKSAAESEAIVRRNIEQALQQDLTTLRASFAEVETKLQETTRKHDELLRSHEALQRTHAAQSKDADLIALERTNIDSAADRLSKHNSQLLAENQRLLARSHQHRDEVVLLKSQLAAQMDLNKNIDAAVGSTENTSLNRVEAENRELKRQLITMDHARQLECNKSVELSEQLQECSRSAQLLSAEHTETLAVSERLSADSRKLQAALEHMTYRANKAESASLALHTTKEAERLSEAQALRGTIASLHKELDSKSAQVAKMNQAFVVAEEKVLEAHRIHSSITAKTDTLHAELRKNEGMSDRLKGSLHELQEDRIGILKENNNHRLTVLKHQDRIAALSARNVELEGKLADAMSKEKLRTESQSVEVATLRAELARSRDKKNGSLHALEESERDRGTWERKFEFLRLKHEAQTKEMATLQTAFANQATAFKALQKEQSTQEKQYANWTKSFEASFASAARKQKTGASSATSGSGGGGSAAGMKLTFSASQNLTARQVLENWEQTAASLPTNSASLLGSSPSAATSRSRVGASIVASGSTATGLGGGASGAAPALDSLNDMMSLMARSAAVGASGSQSARGLPDSDSRSSLLARDGAGAKSSTFLEGLVHELRAALHKSSTLAAERLNELVKLKADMRALLLDQTAAASKEHDLLSRMHLLSTQQQSTQTNLLMAQAAYARAESMCASLERQLRDTQRELMSAEPDAALEHKDASSDHTRSAASAGASSAVRSIDYQYYADLEPSPLLRSILNNPALHASGLHSSSSMQSLRSYALHSPSGGGGDDAQGRSLQQHGRGARVGLGRPNRSPGGVGSGSGSGALVLQNAHPGQLISKHDGSHFSSAGSMYSSPAGHSAIASTVSMRSSVEQSRANLDSSPSSAARSAAASAAVLPGRVSGSPRDRILTASAGTLCAPNASSNQSSFSNLPITVKPSGAR